MTEAAGVGLGFRGAEATFHKGFLSRIRFRELPDVSYRMATNRLLREPLDLKQMLFHMPDMPHANAHPWWVELNGRDGLALNTLVGQRLSGSAIRVDYHGEYHIYESKELREHPRPGDYVVRKTLSDFWQARFAELGFPVRVIPTDELVQDICKRIHQA